MTQISTSTQQSDTLNLRTCADLNQLSEMATRQRDAFIGQLIRQGVIRLAKVCYELVVPPVRPHRA